MGDPGVGAGHKSPRPTGQGKGSAALPGQAGGMRGGELGAEPLLHPQAEELVNTAPLTGVPRRVPVRLVTVDSGGALVEVTEHIGCESANTQVLQVSGMWGLCLLDAHAASLLPHSGPQETSFFFFTSIFWPRCTACWILVP